MRRSLATSPRPCRGLGRIGRALALLALSLVPAAVMPESRISAAPAQAGGGGLSASAGLRIEVHVSRTLSLSTGPAAGSAVWSNAGTVMQGCVGAGACQTRASASAGTSGVNRIHLPTQGLTLAQP